MKFNYLRTVATMVAAVFLGSCVEEEMVGDDFSRNQKITVEIPEYIDDQLGRSCVDVKNSTSSITSFLWQPNDKIGVFTKDGSSGNVPFTNTSEKNVASAEFAGEMSGTPYYAYFPYSSDNDGRVVTDLKGTILAEQAYNQNEGTLSCAYKYGVRKDGTTNQFKFNQLFTMLRITVDASGTGLQGERLNKVVLTITDKDGNQRPICGDFTFNAVDGTWEATGNTSGTLSMPWTTRPTLAKGRSYIGYVHIMSCVEAGDKLAVEVIGEGRKASFTATLKKTFKAGYVYGIPLTLKTYAANVSTYGYAETEIDRPTITNFGFEVANNEGKLINNKLEWNSSKHTPSFSDVSSYSATIDNDKNEISLTIPYLYDFKLKPTFTLSSDNSKVLVNGVSQESAETEVDFTKPVTYTVVGQSGGTRDYIVKVTNTGLPVVVVNQSTSGNFDLETKTVMTGFLQFKKITLNEFVDFAIRNKNTDWVKDDQITVYNADGTIDCTATGGVRLRGNTTRDYPKKPFAVKFNDKTSVLGMPAHKRWVLLANWLDHSMIRNTVAFDIAQVFEYAWRQSAGAIEPGIPWSVHGQNVELVFIENGEAHHVGNYYLCEQIKIDGNRLDIKDSYEDVIEGNASPTLADCGYLLEFDSKEDDDPYFTTSNKIKVKYKDDAIAGTALATAVKNKIQGIEDNLDNGNYTAAYESLDINTVIDQWLIWELTMNREYGDPGSVYMYMDGDGKLCAGPVWDFDRGTFQNQEKASSLGNSDRIKPDNEWMCSRSEETYIWYKQLVKDPIFQSTVQERWAVIKPYLNMIVDQIRYYGQTQAVSYSFDSAMWPTQKADIQEWKKDFSDWSGDEQISDWNEVIDNFVTVFQERLAGMDALITSGTFTK